MKTALTAAAIDAARIISQQCLATRARRLERTVSRLYDVRLRPHGVSRAQLGVLVAVALSGEVQPKTLCTILDREKSTLSRNIALMVQGLDRIAARGTRAEAASDRGRIHGAGHPTRRPPAVRSTIFG